MDVRKCRMRDKTGSKMQDKNTFARVVFANRLVEYEIILKLMTGYGIKKRKVIDFVMRVMDWIGEIESKKMAVHVNYSCEKSMLEPHLS